ncbi:MAG: S8 family serine peptidase [Chitinophagaceae bacterium]|nr:S8 family serine peptidase [Chitinophagaceae bacterium]
MKTVYPLILICIILHCLPGVLHAQKPARGIELTTGTLATNQDLRNTGSLREKLKTTVFKNNSYVLLQFDRLPDSATRVAMAAKGIILSSYLSNNAFYATVPDSIKATDLVPFNFAGIYELPRDLKIAKELRKKLNNNTFRVVKDKPIAIGYYNSVSTSEVTASLTSLGARIVPVKISIPNVMFIEADARVLKLVADLPFVTHMNEQVLKDVAINYINRGLHAVGALSAGSGRNLRGKNVTIGVGDDANPSSHIDFSGRLILRTPASANVHGTHTTGTTAGGGIINPRNAGMAPHATIISKSFSDVLVDAPVYVNDHDMVLTNNSYYSGDVGCVGDGAYNFLSTYLDFQLNALPSLLHVFAAGNDGTLSCTPFVAPYGTIKSGFQCAKNVLTVGNFHTQFNTISGFSSCGPVADGRLKPEIVAGGADILSTFPNNNYSFLSGTSMAAPTVTGTLALLYERYRQLEGVNPPAALIKAVACNSATDVGNTGPDYIYGFGILNARKAVEIIEKGNFTSGLMANGGSSNLAVFVPANTSQLKIMLYWADQESSPTAGVALINNLNLSVTTPSSTVHLPLILNPAAVGATAIEGVDNVNNIEQVVINAPASGNYSVNITGASVPEGPQPFYVVYQIIEPSVTVEYPFGNETLVPGEVENIRWDAVGGEGNTFTIEYSSDNGVSWTPVSTTVPSGDRTFQWTVPATIGNNNLIRISRNGTSYTDVGDHTFSILGQPSLSSVSNPCPGYVALSWTPVTGATGYEVMQLIGDTMQTIATTTSTDYLVNGLEINNSYWFAIRANNGSTPGRRSLAASIIPSGGSCTLAAFDNDYSVTALLSPSSGRLFTGSQLAAESVSIQLTNRGSIPSAGGFNVYYQVNGGTPISETVSTVVGAHSSIDYTFTSTANLSAAGIYIVKTWVTYPGDPSLGNDTSTTIIKQLQNAPLSLNPSFTEGFETAANSTYTSKVMGMDGLDRADFSNDNSNGRVRTFVNSGFARTGNRCVTLDQVINTGTAGTDSLVTTYNLSSYTPADNILLHFYYKNHGINFSLPGNAVWIRGSETSEWIRIFTLPVTSGDIGEYRSSPAFNITELLAAAVPAQSFSSSFQVRFGVQGFKPANSPDAPGINVDNGFSFDDVSLIRTENDLSVTAILQPATVGVCALSGTETIRVEVRNSGSTVATNVPVRYRVDGVTVNEIIASVAANSSVVYDFTTTANLSAYKEYALQSWVDYPGDTYAVNDTTTGRFRTSPLISSFPYLEGFEASDGFWYTGGSNSSWSWGIPSKTIINTAAGGSRIWVTGLTGTHNDAEYSFLYSPCFDVSELSNPSLAFNHIYRTEDNCDPGICDTHWAEYSLDDVTWITLGTQGVGQNWYSDSRNIWNPSNPSWHESIINLPLGASRIRMRIVMSSDPALAYDGVGIDNIRVFDSSFIPLPVTLLSFTAVREQSAGVLNWSTSSESNTELFIVEKSANGIDYTNIGTVKAANAGNVISRYKFMDNNLQVGTTYYRLRMTDKDGSFKYSPLRMITFNSEKFYINILPNPVTKGTLYINTSSNCSKIELCDISGRILKSFTVKGIRNTLQVGDIIKGIYLLRVVTDEGKKTEKIIID